MEEIKKESITWQKKHQIRNNWCDQLCSIFNYYYKHDKKLQIRIPLYTAQVLSTFEILDFNKIDFSEPKINFGENSNRTNNENLIYECFDRLIEDREFIGDFMKEFREYFNHESLPF
jgi:hypothetical protein